MAHAVVVECRTDMRQSVPTSYGFDIEGLNSLVNVAPSAQGHLPTGSDATSLPNEMSLHNDMTRASLQSLQDQTLNASTLPSSDGLRGQNFGSPLSPPKQVWNGIGQVQNSPPVSAQFWSQPTPSSLTTPSSAEKSSPPSSTPHLANNIYPYSQSAPVTPALSNISPPPVRNSSSSTVRLNWAEMISYTISESPGGRLVIQDLFEGMCHKFPDIREWAAGKDWEARVKNRIKSTLSIKSNLFIKVPRPSNASGKGSWWTLSPEAQNAYRQGRIAEAVRGGHTSSTNSLNLASPCLSSHGKSYSHHRRMSHSTMNMLGREAPPASAPGPHFSKTGLDRASFGQGLFELPKDATSPPSAETTPAYASQQMAPFDAGISPALSQATPAFSMMSLGGMSDGSLSRSTINSPGSPASLYAQSPALTMAQPPASYPINYSQSASALNGQHGARYSTNASQSMGQTNSQQSLPFFPQAQNMQLPYNLLHEQGGYGGDFSRSMDEATSSNPARQSFPSQRSSHSSTLSDSDVQNRRSLSTFSLPSSVFDGIGQRLAGTANVPFQTFAGFDNATLNMNLPSFGNDPVFDSSNPPCGDQRADMPVFPQSFMMNSKSQRGPQAPLSQYRDAASFAPSSFLPLSNDVQSVSGMTSSQIPHNNRISLLGPMEPQSLSFSALGMVNDGQSFDLMQNISSNPAENSGKLYGNTQGLKSKDESTRDVTSFANFYSDHDGATGNDPNKVVTAN